MRFRQLDLIRYGKFTDHLIDLPGPNGTGEPDFHLIVDAPQILEATVPSAAAAIAGAVQTLGPGNKTGHLIFIDIDIATRHASAGNTDFTRNAGR